MIESPICLLTSTPTASIQSFNLVKSPPWPLLRCRSAERNEGELAFTIEIGILGVRLVDIRRASGLGRIHGVGPAGRVARLDLQIAHRCCSGITEWHKRGRLHCLLLLSHFVERLRITVDLVDDRPSARKGDPTADTGVPWQTVTCLRTSGVDNLLLEMLRMDVHRLNALSLADLRRCCQRIGVRSVVMCPRALLRHRAKLRLRSTTTRRSEVWVDRAIGCLRRHWLAIILDWRRCERVRVGENAFLFDRLSDTCWLQILHRNGRTPLVQPLEALAFSTHEPGERTPALKSSAGSSRPSCLRRRWANEVARDGREGVSRGE